MITQLPSGQRLGRIFHDPARVCSTLPVGRCCRRNNKRVGPHFAVCAAQILGPSSSFALPKVTNHYPLTTSHSPQSPSTRREPFERFGISPIPCIQTGLITRPAPRAAGIDGSAFIFARERNQLESTLRACFSFLGSLLNPNLNPNPDPNRRRIKSRIRIKIKKEKIAQKQKCTHAFVSFCALQGGYHD